jgi:hypothetical protein
VVSGRQQEANRLEEELATLSAHINAATARLLELATAFVAQGTLADDAARWLAFRCGMTTREARQYLLVAEKLEELPAIRAAFARGELAFTKVRSLVRVAKTSSEEGLLELAAVLTAAQVERALRAFRRLQSEEACKTHELEYLDYHWAEDGCLCLRARLAAEDGTLLVRALEAARERVRERRRAEQAAGDLGGEAARTFEPPRSPSVEAIVEVAGSALAAADHGVQERARLVVHVDAAALTADGHGRSELEAGPVISPETARRLGCDADTVAVIERDGLPVSVGRARRTVPPALRRLLEAHDETCCWPAARAAATSTPTTARTGRRAARRAWRTSCSSAGTTTDSCTRADTPSRTSPPAGCAFATATASSVPASRARRHQHGRTRSSLRTPRPS